VTFDDVLLVPQMSEVIPADVEIATQLTRNISLNVPIMSAAMDTVTEAPLAIAMAQEGGIGIIHKNMTIADQRSEVDKVKRSESGMIVDPVTVSPEARVAEALELMAKFRISGVPVTVGARLVGILTNRDLRFETRTSLRVSELMTKDDLITVSVGTTLEQAKEILHRHKVEKLLVVDQDFNLKGLITVKDIQKQIKYPIACKDSLGRLRVGAALGVTPDVLERAAALVEAKVDVLAVDTAHGHTKGVVQTVEALKSRHAEIDVIAGNIATYEGASDLVAAGVAAVKVGMGPGSICTTRVVSGAGMPQITAIAEAARGLVGDDRVAVRRHGRESRGADPAPGPLLQELQRHGIPGGHEGGLPRPLLSGSRGEQRQAGPRGHRGHGPLQGAAVGDGAAARGRAAGGHGLQRDLHDLRAQDSGSFRPHHGSGPPGESRARRDDHEGGPELQVGVACRAARSPCSARPSWAFPAGGRPRSPCSPSTMDGSA